MKFPSLLSCLGIFFSQGFYAGGAESLPGRQSGGEWPQYRGPSGDGRAEAKNLPVEFGETKGVRWKTPVEGKAWSSPVIWGNQVWLTNATSDGRKLSVVCLNRETGAVELQKMLFEVENPQFCHEFNSYASPTPVLEQGRLYASFGAPGTACVDTRNGDVLWERRDLECNHFRGAGSSPVIRGNLLLMNFDGSDFQYVVALDKQTGKDVWRTARSCDFKDLNAEGKPTGEGDFRKAFGTPHVAVVQGVEMVLSAGAKAHYAYELATGRELWRYEHGNHSTSARPLVQGEIGLFTSGYGKSQLHAVKLTSRGLLDDSALSYRVQKGIPIKPSLLLVDGLIYLVEDGGFAACLDAGDGHELWRQRVEGAYSASPVHAGGRIYLCGEKGVVTVLQAGREFVKLAENRFDEGFLASPAVAGEALFLRSRTHLYRIEK
jgi:outer membrane protein assembly factor BamB